MSNTTKEVLPGFRAPYKAVEDTSDTFGAGRGAWNVVDSYGEPVVITVFEDQALAMFKAWNSWRKNTKVKQIKWTISEAFPIPK